MPHAPKTSVNKAKMQTKRSAWTPLNHAPSNSQLFEERRALLSKWFCMWTDDQKKTILQDLIQSCSLDQLIILSRSISRRLPLQATDFTCMLPRVLSLYIFSFLDPRSLCRCAQVSWRWKSLVDLEQLWMVKCVRRGWFLDVSPTPFEVCVWKRHYISTVERLRSEAAQWLWLQQQRAADSPLGPGSGSGPGPDPIELCLEDALLTDPGPVLPKKSTAKKTKHWSRSSLSLPPWRDADRKPKDIVRFNYLDNSLDVAVIKLQTCPASTVSSGPIRAQDSHPSIPEEAPDRVPVQRGGPPWSGLLHCPPAECTGAADRPEIPQKHPLCTITALHSTLDCELSAYIAVAPSSGHQRSYRQTEVPPLWFHLKLIH
uniref:F-box domain-containing protein n=1 Tax=Knipowitschia caucasica TaxID=637954 RepID=A0AAV2KD56_KNICA